MPVVIPGYGVFVDEEREIACIRCQRASESKFDGTTGGHQISIIDNGRAVGGVCEPSKGLAAGAIGNGRSGQRYFFCHDRRNRLVGCGRGLGLATMFNRFFELLSTGRNGPGRQD